LRPSDQFAWILSGDVPGLRPATLAALAAATRAAPAGLALTWFEPDDPQGYGRLLRDEQGRVVDIREERDATPEQRAIRQCNAGVYGVRTARLAADVAALVPANAQGELYFTDVVGLAARDGAVGEVRAAPVEVAGVNTPEQLAALEAQLADAGARD
jgi:bifunctional UDP-N-acetylglucosamine pyrophosphorylase/glucosamine-1-phosphate N-acetyltransferase